MSTIPVDAPQIDTPFGLEHVFTYHPPFGDQPQRYSAIRRAALDFAMRVLVDCPRSAERTLALRDIQRAVMFANASIALNEAQEDK